MSTRNQHGILIILAILMMQTACSQPIQSGGTYVWLDVPQDGLKYPDVQAINIEGHAASPAGASRVELWVNGELLTSLENLTVDGKLSRFQTAWTPLEAGEYTIQAIAFSSDGAISQPDSARVTIGGTTPTEIEAAADPDLAVLSVEAVEAGEKDGIPFCNIRVVYANAGEGAVPADFSIQFSFDGTPQQTTLVAGGLPPGASAEVIFVYQFQDQHYIGINLDSSSVIAESNEGNNAFAEARQCGPPVPDATPTPPPTAAPVIQFWAEPTEIEAGSCTRIRWHVENVQTVIFGGIEQSFDGSYEDCLCSDQRYTLRIVNLDGSEEERQVSIDVSGACVTPTPVDNTPPPVPSPAVPADGLTLTCRASQTLVWLPVEDKSGIAEYRVQVERHSGDNNWMSIPGSTFTGIEGKTIDISVECGWYYRWRVRAVDGKGNAGDWSDWWEFTVTLT